MLEQPSRDAWQVPTGDRVDPMTNVLVYIWAVIAILSLSSVSALIWAISSGQLGDFQKGAMSIFDEDEPIGETTDSFPDD